MREIKLNFAISSFWFIAGRGSSNLIGFLIFALLARFLGPRDFGLVAFAALFIDITRPLALLGFPQAMIQRPTWDDAVASNAFWANVVLSLVLAVLLGGVFAPFMAAVYNPHIGWVIPALAFTLLIDAARALHEAKLQREFSYKSLAKRTVFASIFGGIVGVTLAYCGFGIWALVASRLVISIAQTAMIWWTVRWVPEFTFSFAVIRPLLAFGLHVSSAAILSQINVRASEFIIGLFLGPASLGFYKIGTRAVGTMNDVVIEPMKATTLSALSRVNGRGSVAQGYLRITKACSILSFPVYFGAATIAQDFVVLCFGPQWKTSGDVMAMLALLGGAATLNNFAMPALTAVGQTRLANLSNLVSLLTSTVIALVLVRYGIAMVAMGFALRGYLTIPFVLWMLRRGLGLSPIQVLRGLAAPFLSATVMAVSIMILSVEYLQGLHPLARMSIMVSTGVVLYAVCLLVVGRAFVSELRAEVMPIFRRLKKQFKR